jgi:hypothetical protein
MRNQQGDTKNEKHKTFYTAGYSLLYSVGVSASGCACNACSLAIIWAWRAVNSPNLFNY